MQIGIPTETVVGENRVAATPETVKKLISAGHSVVIERGAGVKAAYIDSAYEQVGATMTDDAYRGSQMILKVRAPKGEEIQKLAPNSTVVAMFDPYRNTELDQFAAAQVSAFALELLPRTCRVRKIWTCCHHKPTWQVINLCCWLQQNINACSQC